MPKRILYIHGISEIGGAEQDLLRLFGRIDRQQFELFVVCPPTGPLLKEIEQLKVPVYPMNLPSWRKLKGKVAIPWTVWTLFKLIRGLQINLVHVNDFWWSPIAYMASRMAHVPCIAHIRSQIEPERVKQYWLKKSNKLVAVSHSIKTVAVGSGVNPTRISVVYSGIDASLTVNPADGKRIRKQYNLMSIQPVIGTLANLFSHKGYEYLIEAISEVSKKIPNIHCLFIGEGDKQYRSVLEKKVGVNNLNRNVTFTGFQQDVMAYISAMDIFVLPSVLEGLPIALLEAMAMGKPVVATAVGGIPEVVEDHVTGLLVPPRDPKALAKKILYLLENPRIREDLGLAGRARVLERFSLDRMTSQLQSLYGELV